MNKVSHDLWNEDYFRSLVTPPLAEMEDNTQRQLTPQGMLILVHDDGHAAAMIF